MVEIGNNSVTIDGVARSLNKQRQSLYNVEWQVMRFLAKGTWNSDELPNKIQQLQAYLATGQRIDDHEYVTRLYRVLNCLDAVYMGWKDKDKMTPILNRFLDYKLIIQDEYHNIVENFEGAIWWRTDTPARISASWADLKDEKLKQALIKDLLKRFTGSTKRWDSGNANERIVRSFMSRTELYWFLYIISPTSLMEALDELAA